MVVHRIPAEPTYVLNCNEIRTDQRDVVDLPEHLDDTAVVNARNENSEQVGEESRLLLEVERESLVVAVDMLASAP